MTQQRTHLFGQPAGALCKWALAAATLAAVLAACGGGGGDQVAGVGSGGTGFAVSGPIEGFGSVIVNGTRLDVSSASVTLDDTAAQADDLRLGMTIEANADEDASGTTGVAHTLVARSIARGPIASIDATHGQLVVLGLTVTAGSSTVFDGFSGIDDPALVAGTAVEIYGLPDAQGGVTATRIEKKDATAASGVRLAGSVASLNAGQQTFTLRGTTVHYQAAQIADLQGGLANGALVRVTGSLAADGSIAASQVHGYAADSVRQEGAHVQVDGIVIAFSSAASFTVNNLAVDASTARIDGTPAAGARVAVEGRMSNGVVTASRVQVKSASSDAPVSIELHGAIMALDSVAHSFRLRNTTVYWDQSSEFGDGLSAATLVNGLNVEVKGTVKGDMILMTSIKLDR